MHVPGGLRLAKTTRALAQTYPFTGSVQHYDWGGFTFIPDFIGRGNSEHEPWAELWMGAHPKGPCPLIGGEGDLESLIAGAPERILGTAVAERFADRLPFLFKVLDVRKMLSIQVHPTKAAAEAGYAAEEQAGKPRDAADRNYRDDNHKPELGVALTDFYLLHGFRSPEQIMRTLKVHAEWGELMPIMEDGGVEALYAHVMHADQATIDRLLAVPASSWREAEFDRDQPEFWAARAVEQYTRDGHYDRGIFSIFWFNLVHLLPGEGIFQDAGIPHAYLEGACLELMANSDNVLRGGLTPKHIDVPELLDKTRFDAVIPDKLRPVTTADGWQRYPTPAPDFTLDFHDFAAGDAISLTTPDGPVILLLMSGDLSVGEINLSPKQRLAFIPAGSSLTLSSPKPSRVFRAAVGTTA